MASNFQELRKKQLAARQAQAPDSAKPAGMAGIAPKTEPPQASAPQVAAPAPAAAPAPVSPSIPPVPTALPAPVEAVVAPPAAPAPVAVVLQGAAAVAPHPVPAIAAPPPLAFPPAPVANTEPSEELDIHTSDLVPVPSGPAPVAVPDVASAAPAAVAPAVVPSASLVSLADSEMADPDNAAAHVPARPVPREPKRVINGTLAFDQIGDNGPLPCKYKLSYKGPASATSCNFWLIGKQQSQITLELFEPQELVVPVKGGEVKMTLIYKGASKEGQKEVEFEVEGGIGAVTGIFERARLIGPATVSVFKSAVTHLRELSLLAFSGGLAACGFAIDAIGESLGRLHPYVTVAVPAVMAGLAIWAWGHHNKELKKAAEQQAGDE